MPTALLTDLKVRNAKALEKEYLLADGSGLFLRVRPQGEKTWLFIFSLQKRQRKHGLGVYPTIGLKEAREEADRCRALVARGVHPAEDKRAQAIARADEEFRKASRLTVRKLFDEWMRKEGSKRKDGGRMMRSVLEKHALPYLGELPAADVSRRHVMHVLDEAVGAGIRRQANILLQLLRQMFKFAVMREIMAADPTYGLRKKDVGGKEVERDRVLSEAEIREFALKVAEADLNLSTRNALWIMLATICRAGELGLAKWEHINLNAGTWVIPAENSKNGREHLIHLSDFAKRRFQELLDHQEAESDWVFPNRTGKGPRDKQSIQHQVHDRQRDDPIKTRASNYQSLRLSGGRWTGHDLRRSGATLMGELGVLPDVIDRCLNHIEPRKVTRTYQRQVKLQERMQAFKVLGDRLEILARGQESKVVSIPQRAAA